MSREVEALDIRTIALGGLVEEANKALQEALDNAQRYPKIKKARTVEIKITLEHEYHEELDEFSVTINHYAVAGLPKLHGRADRAKRLPDGSFVVAGSPHVHTLEARQTNIFEMQKAFGDKGGE